MELRVNRSPPKKDKNNDNNNNFKNYLLNPYHHQNTDYELNDNDEFTEDYENRYVKSPIPKYIPSLPRGCCLHIWFQNPDSSECMFYSFSIQLILSNSTNRKNNENSSGNKRFFIKLRTSSLSLHALPIL